MLCNIIILQLLLLPVVPFVKVLSGFLSFYCDSFCLCTTGAKLKRSNWTREQFCSPAIERYVRLFRWKIKYGHVFESPFVFRSFTTLLICKQNHHFFFHSTLHKYNFMHLGRWQLPCEIDCDSLKSGNQSLRYSAWMPFPPGCIAGSRSSLFEICHHNSDRLKHHIQETIV